MIYTSYFANLRNIPENIQRVSIARYCDRFPDIPKYEILAPSKQLLFKVKNGIVNQYQYKREFNHYLNQLDAEKVVEDLNNISKGRDIVLLCYEGRDKFCHRQLVCLWLINNGIKCQEYGDRELSSQEWLAKLGYQDPDDPCPVCPDEL